LNRFGSGRTVENETLNSFPAFQAPSFKIDFSDTDESDDCMYAGFESNFNVQNPLRSNKS